MMGDYPKENRMLPTLNFTNPLVCKSGKCKVSSAAHLPGLVEALDDVLRLYLSAEC